MDNIARQRPSAGLQAGLVVGVVLLAAAGYALTGAPGRAAGQPPAAAESGPFAEALGRMQQRLREQPEDAAGWATLARAYAVLGRHADAMPAFRRALALSGSDSALLADAAESLVAMNDGRVVAEARTLVDRALRQDPGQLKALALSGSAAVDDGDDVQAVRQWERVEAALPANSPLLPPLQAGLAQARQRLAATRMPTPPAGAR
jgi:cytochrome c-type biogenesis protein CcmH